MQANKEKIDVRKREVGKISSIINKLGVYVLVIALMILGTIISPKFLTASNFMNIIQAVSLLGMVAAGVSFITYSGNFVDMSIPCIMAFSGMIAVDTLRYGIVVSIVCGLLTGSAIGLINGIVVGKLKANPIIWTLSVAFVGNGFMRWFYSGKQIYPDVKGGAAADVFINLSRTDVFGRIPLIVIVMITFMVLGQFVMTKTKFGKQVKLIGSSYEVAKMTGINVNKVVCGAFILSALATSIAGIFLTSLAKTGAFYNGEGYDFNAVTAIVIGGMTLNGGRGDVVGVLGGVLVIGLLSNVMTLIGINTFSQSIVKGIIFIAVVGINARSLRKLGRDDA
ncbi:MAG: Ribose/xylose/arabinose/galactoside ABC-type transport system, permease component [Clostridia bacterium]|jgi:ribose/xylose/arabinose/galactoside ABC-type transport system permease subunit|nr:Ribose/xylose/arabinose/galactoside ABC-type transport system, permease component [Clostridia bacterium]